MATKSNRTRHRGDTYRIRAYIQQGDGSSLDITGYSFKLTVNSEENPTDTSNQLFQLTGSVFSGIAGTVDFPVTALDADQTPGNYYYDIEMTTDTGEILTVAEGLFIIKQDKTK